MEAYFGYVTSESHIRRGRTDPLCVPSAEVEELRKNASQDVKL